MVYGKLSGTGEIKMFQCNDDGNVTTADGCPDLKKDGSDNVAYQNVSLVMTKPIAKDFMEKINSILVKILNPTAPKLTTEEISVITQVKGPIYRYMLSSTTMLRQPNIDDPLLTNFVGLWVSKLLREMAD
jgi:hypothetical protein